MTQCSLEISLSDEQIGFMKDSYSCSAGRPTGEVEVGTLCNLSLQIEASQEPKPKSSFWAARKGRVFTGEKQSSLLAGEDL